MSKCDDGTEARLPLELTVAFFPPKDMLVMDSHFVSQTAAMIHKT
jgi:hypothetical protein